MEEGFRDPCPYRIIDDFGGAFAMGAIGGSLWHAIKGYRNSPPGIKFRSSISAVKARAPVLGGNFAAWGGTFSMFDCTLAYIRQKEDPWNPIMSGFLTGGVLAARGGLGVATRSAVFGGVLLAMIEGLNIAITRALAGSTRPVLPEIPEAPMPPKATPMSSATAPPRGGMDGFGSRDSEELRM